MVPEASFFFRLGRVLGTIQISGHFTIKGKELDGDHDGKQLSGISCTQPGNSPHTVRRLHAFRPEEIPSLLASLVSLSLSIHFPIPSTSHFRI